MLEVERPGDELAWRAFASSRRVAWKTGTSYGFRDAWAIGVTPAHAVGVWVGNAVGRGPARAHRPLGGRADPVRPRRRAAGGGAWFGAARRGPRGRRRLRAQRHARRPLLREPAQRARAAGRARLAAVRLLPADPRRPGARVAGARRLRAARGDPERVVVRASAGARDPLPPAPRRLPAAAALPVRLPRRPRRARGSARCPSCLRARTPSSTSRESSTARAAVWCSRPHTATRSARVFWHLDDEYQGETRRRAPDGARPAAGAAPAGAGGRARRERRAALHGRGEKPRRFC